MACIPFLAPLQELFFVLAAARTTSINAMNTAAVVVVQAAMLREGIARAKAILRESEADDVAAGAAASVGGAGAAGARGKRRREEKEAKRLLGLDLGQHSRFAALAEKCLELQEAVRVFWLV